MARRRSSVRPSVRPSVNFCANRFFSPPNFHKMDSRSACIQGMLKVKVKVKGHVIRALSWILGMSYSVVSVRSTTRSYLGLSSSDNK